MSHTHEVDVDHHVKIYVRVFAALLVLTVITVAVTKLELSTGAAIALALFIASIKASLVACYFMHLIDETKMILWILAVTVLFFLFELIIPPLTEADNIGIEQAPIAAPAEDHQPAH